MNETAEEIGSRLQPRDLCDTRLRELSIWHWTNINIDNQLAAKCISLYLETDHPLLGHFDPELFIQDLISKGTEFCSPLLVNALLYWACVRAILATSDFILLINCSKCIAPSTTIQTN